MIMNLTFAGMSTLFYALAGKQLIFTKIEIGNGEAQEISTATNLNNPLMSREIDSITAGENSVIVSASFNNAEVEAGFRYTEAGVYCLDPNDSSKEILYAYGSEADAKSDYISASVDKILETQIDLIVFVGEAKNVTAAINQSLVYASAAELKAHTDDTANPHKVTKEQIGLGNVANLRFDEQIPNFSEANDLTKITPGEKIQTIFGKIAKAISSLVSHISNKSNPHKVTYRAIGAAASQHSHSASEINLGVLGVRRGGTGCGQWNPDGIIYPSSADTFTQVPRPKITNAALRQGLVGAPYWGPVCDIVTGSYIGNGKYGADAYCHIDSTISTPKLMMVYKATSLSFALFFLECDSYVRCQPAGTWARDGVVRLVSGGIEWKSDGSAAGQMNESGINYRYIILG